MNEIHDIISVLSKKKFYLSEEKITQVQIYEALTATNRYAFTREYYLDKEKLNKPDFFETEFGIAIEVKIKGQKKAIYRQCERYCKFDQVKYLILCTNKSLGFPPEINGKPCYYIHLGKAWL